MHFIGLSKGAFSETSKMDRFEKCVDFLAGELWEPIIKKYLENCLKNDTCKPEEISPF